MKKLDKIVKDVANKYKKVQKRLDNLTLGSDPEVCIMDVETKNIVSSIPVLKVDKNNPINLDKATGLKMFADNSLAEFSFNPSKTKEEFVNKYRSALKIGQKYLGDKYKLVVKSAHNFKDGELEAAYGIDPNLIGCSSEFDFYKEEVKDLGAFESSMRSGSSHLHIGGDKVLTDFHIRHKALRVLEIYLGCASIIWDNDETSKLRRTKYGKAGSFRPTPYGFEARFMSNYMLNSPKLVELTYDLIKYSISHIFAETYQEVIDSVNENEVKEAIDNCDKSLALSVLKKAKLPKEFLDRVIGSQKMKFKDTYEEWGIV